MRCHVPVKAEEEWTETESMLKKQVLTQELVKGI